MKKFLEWFNRLKNCNILSSFSSKLLPFISDVVTIAPAFIIGFEGFLANNDSIGINYEVYKSEKLTGDRNRAMAYLLKNDIAPAFIIGFEGFFVSFVSNFIIELNGSPLGRIY